MCVNDREFGTGNRTLNVVTYFNRGLRLSHFRFVAATVLLVFFTFSENCIRVAAMHTKHWHIC